MMSDHEAVTLARHNLDAAKRTMTRLGLSCEATEATERVIDLAEECLWRRISQTPIGAADRLSWEDGI